LKTIKLHITNLADKQISSAFNGFNRSIKPELPFFDDRATTYSRPLDYLTIPTITRTTLMMARIKVQIQMMHLMQM
jgi:hypothetical protein